MITVYDDPFAEVVNKAEERTLPKYKGAMTVMSALESALEN